MPTYDYVCGACDHRLEVFQSITAPPKKKCPACGRRKLRRLIGCGAAIVFKGSGFYQTDYRSESYKKAAAAENKTGSASGSNGSGSSSSSSSSVGSAAKESKSDGGKSNAAC
jgi:putative FmdB family regulatory protein